MIENGQQDGGYTLRVGGKRIPFKIEFRQRMRLAITVHPTPWLEVVAPADTNCDAVLARVEKRARWVLKQWTYFEQFLPTHPSPRYVSGETHKYLGRQYRLKVIQRATEEVKLFGKFLHVWVIDRADAKSVESLIDAWYRCHADQVFRRRLNLCWERCKSRIRSEPPRLVLRRMAQRWGSCTKAGNILLNVDLIKAPIHCVDYVIMHELCHLQIHNHSDAFYRLLGSCMPDWERRKQRLEECQLL